MDGLVAIGANMDVLSTVKITPQERIEQLELEIRFLQRESNRIEDPKALMSYAKLVALLSTRIEALKKLL